MRDYRRYCGNSTGMGTDTMVSLGGVDGLHGDTVGTTMSYSDTVDMELIEPQTAGLKLRSYSVFILQPMPAPVLLT